MSDELAQKIIDLHDELQYLCSDSKEYKNIDSRLCDLCETFLKPPEKEYKEIEDRMQQYGGFITTTDRLPADHDFYSIVPNYSNRAQKAAAADARLASNIAENEREQQRILKELDNVKSQLDSTQPTI